MSVYVRIRHRFGPRLSEWFLAVITLQWGIVLLLPGDVFADPIWHISASIMSEGQWGWLMIVLGVLRLGGLIVNGARREVTPWIRVISAGIGFLIWSGIAFALGFSGYVTTGLAVYPAIAVLELFNIHRAAHDVGESHADSPWCP